MSSSVRVRFAPSPTGYLHVGGIRSALFNWLWARHNGGVFVLRIEDTDRARLVDDAFDQINDSLEVLGITPDEGPRQGGEYGPYLQSERLDIYHQHADTLVESGALYRCWCTPERLTKLREEAQARGEAFKYDRHCLIEANRGKDSDPHVLRFRIPDAPETIGWDDAVRGRLDVKLAELDDFVAIKADGYPTYHFANVVDDHLMAISHVLRADEWIPSTPKHLLLFEAFGWDKPIYAHLPAVQGPTGGKKLSKRDGAQSVQEYIEEGYLPEALRSFLATLGWNDGTTDEVYATDTLIERFTLERIQKSPARFDRERLTWVNGLMIRQLPVGELLKRCEGFWPTEAATATPDFKLGVLRLVQDRLKFLRELPDLTDFFFVDPTPQQLANKLPTAKIGQEKATQWLEESIKAVNGHFIGDKDFTHEELEYFFRDHVASKLELDKQVGPLFMLIRVALTGKTATPGLFETMALLGRDISLQRLTVALDLLRNKQTG
jgi:glutamyl-tRNA synthetase